MREQKCSEEDGEHDKTCLPYFAIHSLCKKDYMLGISCEHEKEGAQSSSWHDGYGSRLQVLSGPKFLVRDDIYFTYYLAILDNYTSRWHKIFNDGTKVQVLFRIL